MSNRRKIASRVELSQGRLEQEIRELEAALLHQGPTSTPGKRWKQTLLVKSLEDRRRLLAGLRRNDA